MEIASITPGLGGGRNVQRPGPEETGALSVEAPGRAGAPGQLAKAAIAAAREAGAELPANAQGRATSAIARGADPATVFEARLPQTEQGPGTNATEDVNSADPAAEEGPSGDAAAPDANAVEDFQAPESDAAATGVSARGQSGAPVEDADIAVIAEAADAREALPQVDEALLQYRSAAQAVATVTPLELGEEAGLNRSL